MSQGNQSPRSVAKVPTKGVSEGSETNVSTPETPSVAQLVPVAPVCGGQTHSEKATPEGPTTLTDSEKLDSPSVFVKPSVTDLEAAKAEHKAKLSEWAALVIQRDKWDDKRKEARRLQQELKAQYQSQKRKRLSALEEVKKLEPSIKKAKNASTNASRHLKEQRKKFQAHAQRQKKARDAKKIDDNIAKYEAILSKLRAEKAAKQPESYATVQVSRV